MSERIAYGRKKLHNYSALDGLNNFLQKIVDNVEHFDFVSATERRCYNIVVRFLPFLNIISNNALLLMYQKMADRYEQTGELPKILIIDDIMIHGRGLSRFLYQFEAVIIEELEHRGHLNAPEDYLYFRMQFTKAVTIYIYAKNSGALLLAPRFLPRIEPWEEMYVGKLRNLSMQLQDCLSRWDIANTSYAYSVRSVELANDYESMFIKHIRNSNVQLNTHKMTKVISKGACKEWSTPWVPISWRYNSEDFFLYFKLSGNGMITKISTVRLVPKRANKKKPLITSYTILGDITRDTLDNVCRECAEVLTHCRLLRTILLEKNERLKDIKAQLLCTLLSIVDFDDFCCSVLKNSYKIDISALDDLRKIARNYSGSPLLFHDLKTIVCSSVLQEALRKVFAEYLSTNVAPLIDTDISTLNNQEFKVEDTIENIQSINNEMLRLIYQLGADAEEAAFYTSVDLDRFHTYEYSKSAFMNNKQLGLSHGILPLRLCVKEMFGSKDKGEFSLYRIFEYFASFVCVMDNGVISVRQALEKFDDSGETISNSVVKAGEMAVFFVPQRFGLFIPAFAEIEEKYYGNSNKQFEAISSFVCKYLKSKEILGNIITLIAEKEDQSLALVKHTITTLVTNAFGDEKHFKDDLQLFFRIGHSFTSWNFLNLTHQDSDILSAFQIILTDLAKRIK